MEKKEDYASTESVFNYFVENAGPIYDHAVGVFESTSKNFEVELNKQTIAGLSTHLSMLCQMVIVAVAESVYTGKDPNVALNTLNQFILSWCPNDMPESREEKQIADSLVGLLFDKAGKV